MNIDLGSLFSIIVPSVTAIWAIKSDRKNSEKQRNIDFYTAIHDDFKMIEEMFEEDKNQFDITDNILKEKSKEYEIIIDNTLQHAEDITGLLTYRANRLKEILSMPELDRHPQHISEIDDNTFDHKNILSEDVSQKLLSESEKQIVHIKNQISQKYGINKKFIKYSRDYPEREMTDDYEKLQWSTWYVLSEQLISQTIKENDEIYFIISTQNKYQGIKMSGAMLRKLSKKMKPRNSKRGRVYDFYIAKDNANHYQELRNAIPLYDYDIESLDLSFLDSGNLK